MADDRKKLCSEQLSILIEEIENDPSLLNAKSGSQDAKRQYIAKWENLAMKLNSVENGAVKNVTKWQQAWRDWKSNTKKKASKVQKSKGFCEENNHEELTSLELRLLNIYNDQPDVKAEGIDISHITEIDPLFADDSSDHHQDEHELSSYSPAMTVYSQVKTEAADNLKRHCSDQNDNIKRKRIRTTSSDTAEILSRLTSLEASRQEADRHHNRLLEMMAAALDRQAAATVRQAEAIEAQTHAMDRIVDLLGRRGRDS